MKLSALYTVFNACELLDKSIEQIYPFVDSIIISVQVLSNTGKAMNPKDMEYVVKAAEKYNDKIKVIKYNTQKINPKENERQKHQQLIDEAKIKGSTHFVLLATDHFYEPAQFEWAKKSIESYQPDVSVTKMYTYYKFPTWRLNPIEEYYMPFICKLYANTRISTDSYPVRVDPSVKVNTSERFLEFHQDEVILHHYSMVRQDIESKFNNAAAAQNWPDKIKGFIDEFENYDIEENKGVSYFKGRKIQLVPNKFDI